MPVCLALAKLSLLYLRHENNFQVTVKQAGWGGKEAMEVEKVETVKGAVESSEQSQVRVRGLKGHQDASLLLCQPQHQVL